MTEVIGYQTILSLALPTGVDGTKLAQWQLKDGKTFPEVAQLIATSLTGLNQEFTNKWGWLYFLTEEIMMEYPDGGSVTKMPIVTDTDDIDPIRGTTIAHQIDLLVKGDAFGGSKRFFRDMRSAQLVANIKRITDSAKWRFEYDLLYRWFDSTETLIGTTGYNVPFVRGTGGAVDFAPPAYDGEAFTTSHTHYLGIDTGTYGFGDMLNQQAEHLQEHGHDPDDNGYTAMVSRADVASYYALPDFVRPISGRVDLIDRATTTADTGAAMFSRTPRKPGLIGWFESQYGTVEVLATNRIPTGYSGMVKSYGQLSEQNPMAIRVHPQVGFGVYVVPETTNDNQWPLKKVNVEFEYGVGVGRDRTNGTAAYLVAGGVWADPVIS